MSDGNGEPAQRPSTGDGTSPDPVAPENATAAEDPAAPRDRAREGAASSADPVAPGDVDLPWKATPERRNLWGPIEKPLEGTVHDPASGAVGRRRSGLFSLGIPLLAGGLVGAACLVVGLGTAILGPLGALGIAAGAGLLAAGGSGVAVRALRSPRTPQVTSGPVGPQGTAEMLEKVRGATAETRERTRALRRRASEPTVGLTLEHVETLLRRIDALADSEQLRAQRPYEGEVTMLEGMATRYLPELVDAAADIIGFLETFAGSARQEALENLEGIDRQLAVLGDGLEQIESDLVAGVSRSLEVHAEFLRTRFADQHLNPIIDV
ncbi:hypothetical protein BH708_13875 [Brachybacterium sp. P6-10-X1]|uniref:hypothetical protein n=1 Tax=Brachybacterium sp. P6-10-X1 TaxID=1903186 RepID=UPI0009718B26|nr:hypothetical protein [Brachybacterium sp. P6-10-X1]APX33624.1 hypothetical protein BH708_13875 [Brachybacterium sp. P6-10-X1]